MIKTALVICLTAVLTISAKAAIVAQYDFEDGTPGAFNASVDSDANSTASNFASGGGISGFASSTIGDNTSTPFATSSGTGDVNGSPDGSLFTGSSADQTTEAGAVTNNDYLGFTLTPNSGVTYNFNTLQFKVAFTSATTNNPPEGYFVRSSLTGTTDLASGTIATVRTSDGAFDLVTVDLSAIGALQSVGSAVTFQIYFYNPDGVTPISTGDRLDKVLLDATAVPEPSTWAMIASGAGLLVGLQRLRRRRA